MTGQTKSEEWGAVLQRLATRLVGASIRRSDIQAVLESFGAPHALGRRVDVALRDAQIQVIEDVVVDGPDVIEEEVAPVSHAGTDIRTAAAAVKNPLDVARERLALDRQRSPHRLAKVILTAEEEVGLTLLARPDSNPLAPGGFALLSGEARQAAEALLLHNMGLIHSVAQRLGGQGLDYDDMVAHGVPGLVRAIELFDPHRGLKFSTYAVTWVRQSISRAIANEGRIIRLPVHVIEAVRKVKAVQERLTLNGRMPQWSEIARECQISVEKVGELLRLAPAVVSLDQAVGNDGVTLSDFLVAQHDDGPVEVYGLTADDLSDLLSELSEREADILRRRHGLFPYDEGQTLDEIGVVYGVTRERIRQLEKAAIKSIRVRLRLDVERPKGRGRAGTGMAATA